MPIDILRKALSTIDSGLLLGAGMAIELKTAAKLLSDLIYKEELKDATVDLDTIEFTFKDSAQDWIFPGISGAPVEVLDCPSVEGFSKYFFGRTPIKIVNCIKHWPALEKWKLPAYLIRVSGGRKVPVEVGGQYTATEWGMKLTTFRNFVLNHVLHLQADQSTDKSASAYLAQHPLFDQVEELRQDIDVLDYCALSEKDNDDGPHVDINAWFGPAGTVSPLHTDPKHNLLCQVVGRKRVILYGPDESSKLYAYDNRMMHNTAKVDPEKPNFADFPDFQSASALECHLYPGDVVYIPPKWWHHVRALDISFSVSLWWE